MSVRGDCRLSVLGPPSTFPVVIRCVCCNRMILRSEVVSCDEYSRSAVVKALVVVISLYLSGMLVHLDRNSLRRGRSFRDRWI